MATTALVVLCLCSSLSSSVGAGIFISGAIPGTQPHMIKSIEGDKLKPLVDWIRPKLLELKTKYPEIRVNAENATEEKIEEVVKDLDKTKCKELKNLIRGVAAEIEKNGGSDTVFTLGGSIDIGDAVLDYLELETDDIGLLYKMCTVRENLSE